MRIFFIGASAVGTSGMASDVMEAHILTTLRDMGHACAYFDYRSAVFGPLLNSVLSRAAIDLGWLNVPPIDRVLTRRVRAFQPDLIMTLLGNYTSPATIKSLRSETNAPIICWVQDHMGTMGRQYVIGSGYDFIFAKDMAMVELLRRYTRQTGVHYLAEACNPAVHRPLTPSPEQRRLYACDVTTAATLYYYRSAVLEEIGDFDLKIWGAVPRFYRGPLTEKHAGGTVAGYEKAACFNSARIVINTLFPTEIDGLNARAFEAAGCGAFQLINASPAIARHFTPGKDIEVFSNLAELREKLRYFLDHEPQRRAIAEAAWQRSHRDHSYELRLREMLETVFGREISSAQGFSP